jgi:hypothetical protein
MVKIKTLINVRHQFMTLVTGITGFIISYTEVVKEIERSAIPSEEKVKKYDEAIRSGSGNDFILKYSSKGHPRKGVAIYNATSDNFQQKLWFH